MCVRMYCEERQGDTELFLALLVVGLVLKVEKRNRFSV